MNTKDIQNPDIPLDLAALIFGSANDFNEIYRRALERGERKERKQEPKEVNE